MLKWRMANMVEADAIRFLNFFSRKISVLYRNQQLLMTVMHGISKT